MDPQQLKQDLFWLINSPSLINPDLCDLEDERAFSAEEIDAEHLLRFFDQPPTHRVGQYFENLFQYWRQHLLREELVLHRQRIFRDSQTLGEIDFVFQTPTGKTVHWEIAAKFYLRSEQPHSTGSYWIGPNSRDTFERKMNRLFDHQLQMGKHLDVPIDVAIPFVKGRLYVHPFVERPESLPDRANPAHLRGLWIYRHEIEWLENQASRFRRLEKPFWLSDLHVLNGDEGEALFEFPKLVRFATDNFQKSSRPLHIAMMEKTELGWIESARLFVVNDDWPAEQ